MIERAELWVHTKRTRVGASAACRLHLDHRCDRITG